MLLPAPPPVARLTDFSEMFEGAVPKAEQFSAHYRCVAMEKDCAFLDAGQVVVCSDLDGIHLEAEEHGKLGVAAAERVREILG